jgi:hypothetical protein
MDNPEESAVLEAARRLHHRAARWSVEIPEEWYVTGDDGESVIGGIFYERVRDRIRRAKLAYRCASVSLVGGILGIASFVRGC